MDALWKVLESPLPLLELISPLTVIELAVEVEEEEDDDDDDESLYDLASAWVSLCCPWSSWPTGLLTLVPFSQTFAGHLDHLIDWNRFSQEYARRVRFLHYDDTARYRHADRSFIAPSALKELVFFHPFGPALLPRLRGVAWKTSRIESNTNILPFLGPAMKDLTLDMVPVGRNQPRLFSTLSYRTPNLVRLRVQTSGNAVGIESSLSTLVSTCQTLEYLELPRFWNTEKVVEVAGALPNLKALVTNFAYYNPGRRYGNKHKEARFGFSGGTFPKLENVDCEILSLQDSRDFFNPIASSVLSRLTSIGLTWRCSEKPEDLRTMMSHLTNCPSLVVLHLNLYHEDEPSTQPIHISQFHPLFSCRRLEVLIVGHDLPITMGENDVRDFAQAWPLLSELELFTNPSFGETPGSKTSMDILKMFATEIPNLKALGLHFSHDDIPTYDGDLDPPAQFRNLEILEVCSSHVPGNDINVVGFFLSSLCPTDMGLDHDHPTLWGVHPGHFPQETDRIREWEAVRKVMNTASRTKNVLRSKLTLAERTKGECTTVLLHRNACPLTHRYSVASSRVEIPLDYGITLRLALQPLTTSKQSIVSCVSTTLWDLGEESSYLVTCVLIYLGRQRMLSTNGVRHLIPAMHRSQYHLVLDPLPESSQPLCKHFRFHQQGVVLARVYCDAVVGQKAQELVRRNPGGEVRRVQLDLQTREEISLVEEFRVPSWQLACFRIGSPPFLSRFGEVETGVKGEDGLDDVVFAIENPR